MRTRLPLRDDDGVHRQRVLTLLAAGTLSAAALSGCSGSDSAASPSASPAQTRATPSSTPATSLSPATDLCSEDAILAAIPEGSELLQYDCFNVDGVEWAATEVNPGPTVFFLEDVSGSWNVHTSDEICGTASAGFPPDLLDYCTGT